MEGSFLISGMSGTAEQPVQNTVNLEKSNSIAFKYHQHAKQVKNILKTTMRKEKKTNRQTTAHTT